MTKTNHILRSSLISILPVLLFAPLAFGQITNVTDDQSTPTPGAGHDYIKMVNETVNPANGSVSIRIGTPVPKSVGITIPFSFAYDSNGVNHLVPTTSGGLPVAFVSNTSYLSQGGWAYSVPMVSQVMQSRPWPNRPYSPEPCTFFNDFLFQDPSGGRHALYLAYANQTQDGCVRQGIQNVSPSYEDYYYASIVNPVGIYPGVTATDADGTVYTFKFANGHLTSGGDLNAISALPDTIVDRNNNQVTFTDAGNGGFTMQDTAQRSAVVSSGFGTSGNTVAVSGQGSYTVNWQTQTLTGYNPGLVNPGNTDPFCGTPVPTLPPSETVVSSIVLPNGQSYQFLYDSTTGLLQQMTYPTGGYVRYVWEIQPAWEAITTVNSQGLANQCAYEYGIPMVRDRYVSFDGNSAHEFQHQHFDYSMAWSTTIPGWDHKDTTVTTTDASPGKNSANFTTAYHYLHFDVGFPPYEVGILRNQVPVENTITYNDWNTNGGGVLRTETKEWWDQYLLGCDQITLGPSGPSSRLHP